MIPKVKYYGPRIPSTYAVNMTAAASGSNGIAVADDNDIDFGTGDFFIHWEGSLPDWTPSASVNYLYYHYADANNRIGLYVNSSGNLVFFAVIGGVRVCAETTATTISTSTATVSGIDGAIYKISCKFARETASAAGSISYFVNGAQLGSSIAVSAASPPSFTIAGTAYVSGTNAVRVASNTISCIVGNFAPTAAEVLDLCTNGIPASWKWGSQAPVYTSDFSAGADGWTTSGFEFSTAAGNQDGIGGVDNALKIEIASSGSTARGGNRSGTLTSGKKYRVLFDIYIPSTNVNQTAMRASTLGNTLISPALDTWTPTVIEGEATSTALIFRFNSTTKTAGDKAYFKNFLIYPIGATFAALPETIPTSGALAWTDSSGNTGGGTLPAAGATKVTIRR